MKWKTSLNQIVSEEAIKEALSDKKFLKKPKKVEVRIELQPDSIVFPPFLEKCGISKM